MELGSGSSSRHCGEQRLPAWNVIETLLWQLGPIWKVTWRPKYDSRPEIDYNLLFRWFVGLATDDAGVGPRGVFTARVDARKVKDCPKTRGEGPRYDHRQRPGRG